MVETLPEKLPAAGLPLTELFLQYLPVPSRLLLYFAIRNTEQQMVFISCRMLEEYRAEKMTTTRGFEGWCWIGHCSSQVIVTNH